MRERFLMSAVVIAVATATAAAEPQLARQFKAEGDGLVQRGKADEAIASYESAIREDPQWLVAHDALAASLFAAGKFDQVIARLKPIVDKNADYANGWYSLAYAYRKTGKNAESADAYEHYLKLRPDDAEAYYGLGKAQLGLDRKNDAIANFGRYIAREKRPSERRWVEKARGELAALKGKGAVPVAAADDPAAPGARSQVSRAVALVDQGDAAAHAGRWEEAYGLYLQARALDAGSTRAYDGIGESGIKARKQREMVSMFRLAIADSPGYASGYYYLGLALSAAGKRPEALEALKRFAALRPTNPDGLYELGMLERDTGDGAGATQALKRYLEVENRGDRAAARKAAEAAIKEQSEKH